MKYILFAIILFSSFLLAGTQSMYLYKGWNLKGTTNDIVDVDNFLDEDIVSDVYVYRDNKFINDRMAITKFYAQEGFWIYAKKSGSITTDARTSEEALEEDATNPPNFEHQANDRSLSRSVLDSDYLDGDYWVNEGSKWENWWCDQKNWWYCDDDNDDFDQKDIIYNLRTGWNLKGTSSSFRIRDIFDSSCVSNNNAIRVYTRLGGFKSYDKDSSLYVKADSGFWVEASSNCVLKHKNYNSNGSSSSNPPSF